jgi:transposase
MQEENLNLRSFKIGCLPIIDRFIARMGLKDRLSKALSNTGYAEAIIILLKNILTEREAMYALKQWAYLFNLKLDDGSEIGDDRLGRALERLFDADRATLQTEIVLKIIKAFDLKMDQIHNDTTSISAYGVYEKQDDKAIKLKRGHSKDHRPDLKQLVYSLCVTRDGAVPLHFKCYDGNRTDDTIQLETWNSLRVLLQTPNFVYVGDSKLCVEKSMRKIDGEHGFFVTMVPRTRAEVAEFAEGLAAGNPVVTPHFAEAVDPQYSGYIVDPGPAAHKADSEDDLIALCQSFSDSPPPIAAELSEPANRALAKWTGNPDGRSAERVRSALYQELETSAKSGRPVA